MDRYFLFHTYSAAKGKVVAGLGPITIISLLSNGIYFPGSDFILWAEIILPGALISAEIMLKPSPFIYFLRTKIVFLGMFIRTSCEAGR